MCQPKFIEPEWIVPGQEPIIDEQIEDECYDKFQELSNILHEFTFELLWLQCSNEMLLRISSELWSILDEIEQITKLPVNEVRPVEVNNLTKKINSYHKI